MMPVGQQPILWHVMQYYSQYGHRDFVLCLGYKANVDQGLLPQLPADRRTATASSPTAGKKVEFLGDQPPDWRVTLVDTGHLAQHRRAPLRRARARQGRGDVPRQLQRRAVGRAAAGDDRASRRAARSAASSPCVRRSAFHLVEFDGNGDRCSACARAPTPTSGSTAGYFVFRNEIFDYIKEGEELVVEPFKRLIEEGEL